MIQRLINDSNSGNCQRVMQWLNQCDINSVKKKIRNNAYEDGIMTAQKFRRDELIEISRDESKSVNVDRFSVISY